MGEATVACKAATSHFFRNHDVVGAKTGKAGQCVRQSHFAHGTGDVDGHGTVGRRKFQLVSQEGVDKFCRFVQFHPFDVLAHAVQAGTLVAKHRISAVPAGFPQGGFEFFHLAVGYVGHALAFPDGAATQFVHPLREDDLVVRFLQQRYHFVYQRLLYGRLLGQAHGLVDAAGEVNDIRTGRSYSYPVIRSLFSLLAMGKGMPGGDRPQGLRHCRCP